MATLTETARRELWAELMRELSAAGETIAISKADLRALVDAADAWVEANAASFNAALPQPGRSSLTAAEKARLLMAVVKRRYLDGV